MPRQLHWIEKGTKPKLITKHCIIFPLEAEIQRSFNLKFSLFEWIFNSLNLLRAELPHNFSELVNIPTYIFLSNTYLPPLVSTLGLVLLNFNGKIHFIAGEKFIWNQLFKLPSFFRYFGNVKWNVWHSLNVGYLVFICQLQIFRVSMNNSRDQMRCLWTTQGGAVPRTWPNKKLQIKHLNKHTRYNF